MASVDRKAQLEGKLATSGKVNAYSALMALSGGFKQAVPNLVASRPTSLLHLFTPMTESP